MKKNIINAGRLTAILTTALLSGMVLAACGGTEEASAPAAVEEPAEGITEMQQETKIEEKAAEEPAEALEKEEPSVASAADGSALYGGISIEEQLLFDDDGVMLTATGLEVEENTGNIILNLKLDNNTDKYLTMVGSEAIVNGKTIHSAFAPSAEAKDSWEGPAIIFGDALKENGIDKVESIEFKLKAIDGDYNDLFETTPLALEIKTGGSGAASAGSSADPSKKEEKPGVGETAKGDRTYNYFGFYVDGVYVDGDDPDLDPWYVTLKDDGTGFLYFGDDNQGDITEWSGSGDDFTMKAGISVFGDRSFLNDGVMALDFDEYVLLFTTKDADMSGLNVMTIDEFTEANK